MPAKTLDHASGQTFSLKLYQSDTTILFGNQNYLIPGWARREIALSSLWVCLGVWVVTNGLVAARLVKRTKHSASLQLLR
jgi:hypothetical protein